MTKGQVPKAPARGAKPEVFKVFSRHMVTLQQTYLGKVEGRYEVKRKLEYLRHIEKDDFLEFLAEYEDGRLAYFFQCKYDIKNGIVIDHKGKLLFKKEE